MLSNFLFFNSMLNYNLMSMWLDWFHNFNCVLLLIVVFFVFFSYIFVFFSLYFFKLGLSYQELEFYGCILPILFLLIQVIPSLILLFNYSFISFYNDLTMKVIGHQWYWTYELGDSMNLEFDSYMLVEENMNYGDFRLMEVDNRLVLPNNMNVRFVLTSMDVIHSWALPSFFLKLDVMSGMISVFNFKFNFLGVFYGQCSEICGANHSFMPIVVEVSLFDFFKNWVMSLTL